MGIYVGDKRYAPYIGDKRREVRNKKALPYDAEVEYLESTGNQYINTGYNPSYNTKVEAKGRYTYTTIDTRSSMHYLFGARDKTHSVNFAFLWNFYMQGSSNYYNNYLFFGNKSNYYQYDYRNTDITVEMSKDGGYINGVLRLDTSSASSFTLNYPLYLLWANISDGSETNRNPYGRIYYCKIWENDELVHDFIPVRVGQVGYMYDRVSGQLFGNEGTGDFILGNDKN